MSRSVAGGMVLPLKLNLSVVICPGRYMRRREFITLVGGALAALPRIASAQQQSGIRRIGVLSQGSIHNHPTPEFQKFLERLRKLGWTENQNLLIEWRLSEG